MQELLRRITIHPDDELTSRYPQATPVRITGTLRDGRQVTREQDDFERAPSRPFRWARTVEKFHWLAARHAGEAVRNSIVHAVDRLDTVDVSTLTALLSTVDPRRQP